MGGIWPERWPGAIDKRKQEPWLGEQRLLGTEPKAPFHWHAAVDCQAHDAVVIPAWLPHQIAHGGSAKGAVRLFAINARRTDGAGAVGWRLPLPPLLCDAKMPPGLASQSKADEL